MTNNTSLAVREISLPVWQTIQAIAPEMKASGLFNVGNQAAAAAIMLKGYELGLGMAAAFEFIHIIDGKPSLSPRGALAIALQSPLLESIDIKDESNPIGCTVTVKRRGGISYTATFTLDDAKRAGLVRSGGGWDKYPANMARWRAIGFALDVALPDVIGGLKRADELGAELTPAGDVIEGSWTPVSPVVHTNGAAPTPRSEPVADIGARLSALAAEYGADRVLSINGGKLPATLDELNQLESNLAAADVQL